MKIIFENSIFLHQSVGGISKYISKINQIFQKKKLIQLYILQYQLIIT